MSEIERRSGWQGIGDLVQAIHQLETRVVILESRSGMQDDRLLKIEEDLRDTKKGVYSILTSLQLHVEQEGNDRAKLLLGVVATLLSVIGFGAATLINYLLK